MKQVLLTILLTGFAAFLWGQSAGDYLHQGAQHYIHGKKQQAIAAVQQGLQMAPQDPDLQALWELLQKEDEQKDQDQKQDQDQQQDQEDQQKNEDQQAQQKEEQEQEQSAAPQMSKEEIERLLKALSYQEQQLQEKLSKQKAKGKKVKPEKDW